MTPEVTPERVKNPVEQTVNCDLLQHDQCDGYVAPLVYSNTRPCACRCHDHDNPPDFQRGLESARESFYSNHPDYRPSGDSAT